MRSKWACMMVVLVVVVLGCVTRSVVEARSQTEVLVGERTVEHCAGERLERSENVAERLGWRGGIGEWRRRGWPYRNPLRRYRVGKKERKALRGKLAVMAEQGNGLSSVGKKAQGESDGVRVLLLEADVDSGRWG